MAEWNEIAVRRFTREDHVRFAHLSGDWNPMHMDEIAARRTPPGAWVVHGSGTVLWVLDVLAQRGLLPAAPVRLRVRFSKWIYPGDTASLHLAREEGSAALRTRVDVGALETMMMDISPAEGASLNPASGDGAAPRTTSLEMTMEQLEGRRGAVRFESCGEVQQMFPHAVAALGASACAELARFSYVGGMEAPGLHSMSSKFDVTLGAPGKHDSCALEFAVESVDPRFRKSRISLRGTALNGILESFVRHPPVTQPTMREVTDAVTAGEFANMRALVVGGSRGLGELTAKIIAAGGGSVTITYAAGKAEAEAVQDEVRAAGGQINVLPYDVRLKPAPQLVSITQPFPHLFYFATNPMFRPKGNVVHAPYLAEFMAFYVHGFHDLCVELMRPGAAYASTPLTAYYPSSTTVDERPVGITEFAMAKAAGEQMCRDMAQYIPGLRIVTTRLPRLRTDQTASVMPERETDALSVLLPVVREMAAK